MQPDKNGCLQVKSIGSVPKSRKGGRQHEDLLQKYDGLETISPDQVTTLMIRNLPRRYSEEALIYELEAFVTSDSYNFLYLPWDTPRSSNVGYAFVNFVDAPTAARVCQNLNGRLWRFALSSKEVKVMPAHVQGIALNLIHYMGSSVVEDGHAHSPVVMHCGQRINFHKAVALYCPPELISRHLKDEAKGVMPVMEVAPRSTSDQVIGDQAQMNMQIAAKSLGNSYPEDDTASTNGDFGHPDEDSADGGAHKEQDMTAQVLSSDSYRVAWEKLNKQLESLQHVPFVNKRAEELPRSCGVEYA